jgi:hypothetical protein
MPGRIVRRHFRIDVCSEIPCYLKKISLFPKILSLLICVGNCSRSDCSTAVSRIEFGSQSPRIAGAISTASPAWESGSNYDIPVCEPPHFDFALETHVGRIYGMLERALSACTRS